jgi:hypothetical protein
VFFVPMKTYSEKLKDPRWQKARLNILNRDGFACRDCGNDEDELHVHHCFYSKGQPWDTNEELLLTLCRNCHDRRGSVESRVRELIGIVFAASSIDAVELFCADLSNEIRSEIFEDGPDLRVKNGYDLEYETDVRWLFDLREVTGDETAYHSVKAKRKLEVSAV